MNVEVMVFAKPYSVAEEMINAALVVNRVMQIEESGRKDLMVQSEFSIEHLKDASTFHINTSKALRFRMMLEEWPIELLEYWLCDCDECVAQRPLIEERGHERCRGAASGGTY